MADNPQDNANIDDDKTIIHLDDGVNESLKDRSHLFATKVASAIHTIKDNAILKRIFGDKRILYPSIGLFAGIIIVCIDISDIVYR